MRGMSGVSYSKLAREAAEFDFIMMILQYRFNKTLKFYSICSEACSFFSCIKAGVEGMKV